MTPESKKALSGAIRALRERLLNDLHDSVESEYRLSVPRGQDAGLSVAGRRRRKRLEDWLEEQVRALGSGASGGSAKGRKGKARGGAGAEGASGGAGRGRTREDFRREVEARAGYTWLNRLVVLRLLEAGGLRKVKVLTGGWESEGYRTFRELAPGLVAGDPSEGYALLLRLVFEELAEELPGLFGDAGLGVGALVSMPASTLRHVVEALDAAELGPCWTDDMTLGWVYQYWNDPEREALDKKLNERQKLEPHEIASKTQMFTERYMVDWLLQNSLGPLWLAICARNGWTAEVVRDGVLEGLEARRAEWRGRRERGEVGLTELMPLGSEVERRWAYYVPQPQPADAAAQAPASVREVKLLDPAVGSGHFLVVAFELLFALYEEEARQRRIDPAAAPEWSAQGIAEAILENNLHGVDLDARAVQIAAAALLLKAKQRAPGAKPRRVWLVASDLRLAGLPDDDAALVELRAEVERETGIPGRLTDTIVRGLAGADHLGSLLRVEDAVEKALEEHEARLSRVRKGVQGGLFVEGGGFGPEQRELIDRAEAKATILERLESFLRRHTHGDDLGLRLRGEQLAAGVRFVKMVQEERYDLVVGNPPYQGTSKMADARYVQAAYPAGKADLYAAFLLRGLQLVRLGGVSALLTMRNWMFIKQYAELRQGLLRDYDLRALGDLSSGAFEDISAAQVVVSVVMSVFWRRPPSGESVAHRYFDDSTVTQVGETLRKRAATLAGVGRFEFDAQALRVVPEWPVVYWWSERDVLEYTAARKFLSYSPAREGLKTGDDVRFLRRAWEVARIPMPPHRGMDWAPFVKGAEGKAWEEPIDYLVEWVGAQLAIRVHAGAQMSAEETYFKRGIAFTTTGSDFRARAHRHASVIAGKGRSVFPPEIALTLCSMNCTRSRRMVESLNPTVDFSVGDVNRLPLFPIADADTIFATIERAFSEHESHREPSVEFRRPGPSPWRHAQEWAQLAVDRPEGAPLPPYHPEHDPEPPVDHLSYALGVALGRFGPAGEGILDPRAPAGAADHTLLTRALPAGILFINNTLEGEDPRDGLGHPAAAPLRDAFEKHGPAIAPGATLREYLSAAGPKGFFEHHRKLYENRPIHWPLASAQRTFVAWITIHRWDAQTLRVLLADHLRPALVRLEGELADLRAARDGADKKAAKAAEKRLAGVLAARDELAAWVAQVEHCGERGPGVKVGEARAGEPAAAVGKAGKAGKAKAVAAAAGGEREVDARYDPDLDDGVMINAAALWPLLLPFWKDPKKWWEELAESGKKDYDWAHLAMRYWPDRVDRKCDDDPSLAVAHGCFWKKHPIRAWAWELRLQDEIGPEFTIDEAPYRGDGGSDAHRTVLLADHPIEALAAIEREALRRIRKKKAPLPEIRVAEAGLWGARPAECWEMETRVIEKQGADFRLVAPDEASARAALLAASPDLAKRREEQLRRVTPSGLFGGDDEEDDEGAGGGEDDASDEEEQG